MKRAFPPFLTPHDSCVVHGGWHMETPQGDAPLPAEVQHWDYQTVLRLTASVQVQRSEILSSCQLDVTTALVLLVTAHSDHTRTERPVARLDVPREERFDLAVRVELPGAELGGALTLNTALIAASPKALSDLAPSECASILWSARHRTHLQGISAQFPTDACDFSLTQPSRSSAAWVFQLDVSDPESRFLSAARLTLNNGHEAMRDLLSGGDTDFTLQLERTLRLDVTRQMVLRGLALPEVRSAEFDPEATSVAGVLRNVIAAVWPSMTADEVRGRLVSDPASFELDLQHHCKIVN